MTPDGESTDQRLAKLEREVAAAVDRHGNGEVDSVRLAQGEEEADLSSNVDLVVRARGRTERIFTIVSLAAVHPKVFRDSASDDVGRHLSNAFWLSGARFWVTAAAGS